MVTRLDMDTGLAMAMGVALAMAMELAMAMGLTMDTGLADAEITNNIELFQKQQYKHHVQGFLEKCLLVSLEALQNISVW